MSEDKSQELLAAKWSAITFASLVSVVLVSLLLERLLRGRNDQSNKYSNVKLVAGGVDDSDSQRVKVTYSQTKTPKYGLYRKISQKFQQGFLNHPSIYALVVIFITSLKLFVQIFDVWTDAAIGGTFWENRDLPKFVISLVFITAPWVAKWMTFGNFLTEKCKQKNLPEYLSWVHFFFPAGVFLPFFADLYILSRMFKGHAHAFWTGRRFHIEDDLFSLQRTFSLKEAQLESLPQAIFQCGLLVRDWNRDQAGLIFLSFSVSVTSIVLQVVRLQVLARDESFSSVFALIQSLSGGQFIAGVNQIRKSTSSILNLSNIFIDISKMELVSELIDLRPNLHTVILNINILSYPASFIGPWLCRLNRLKLRFLNAHKEDDISDAFKALDLNQDGKISSEEMSHCGTDRLVSSWNYKYGPEYKMNKKAMLSFIQREAIEVPGTCFSMFELAANDDVSENIRAGAEEVVQILGEKLGVDNLLQLSTDRLDLDEENWNGNLVAINGSNIGTIKAQIIDATCVHHLYLPNLATLDLSASSVKRVTAICHADLPSLTTLDLSKCKELLDSEVEFFDGLPNLQEMNLSNSNWENVKAIFSSELPSLVKLEMRNCKSLKTEDIEHIRLCSLEVLDLRQSNWQNAKALFENEKLPLKKLNMRSCKSLMTEDIERIELSCLEALDLSWSNWKNAKTLFRARLPSLEKLELRHCASLKTDEVDHIGFSSLDLRLDTLIFMFTNADANEAKLSHLNMLQNVLGAGAKLTSEQFEDVKSHLFSFSDHSNGESFGNYWVRLLMTSFELQSSEIPLEKSRDKNSQEDTLVKTLFSIFGEEQSTATDRMAQIDDLFETICCRFPEQAVNIAKIFMKQDETFLEQEKMDKNENDNNFNQAGFQVRDQISLCNLKSNTELNGAKGVVVQSADENGIYLIQLHRTGEKFRVLMKNLKDVGLSDVERPDFLRLDSMGVQNKMIQDGVDKEMQGKKSGDVEISKYSQPGFVLKFEVLSKHLVQEFGKESLFLAKNLSLFTGHLTKYMEKWAGRDSPRPCPFTRIPAEILRDFSIDGPVALILKTCFDFRLQENMRKIDFNDSSRVEQLNTMIQQCVKALRKEGYLPERRIYLSPELTKNSEYDIVKLKEIITRHGAVIVEEKDKASHIIFQDQFFDEADEKKFRTLVADKPREVAFVHWWYYPSSYDEWIPLKMAGEPEPKKLPPRQWKIQARWLMDTQKFNEWVPEADYELEGSTEDSVDMFSYWKKRRFVQSDDENLSDDSSDEEASKEAVTSPKTSIKKTLDWLCSEVPGLDVHRKTLESICVDRKFLIESHEEDFIGMGLVDVKMRTDTMQAINKLKHINVKQLDEDEIPEHVEYSLRSENSEKINRIPDCRKEQPFKYLAVIDIEATCMENELINPQEIIEFPVHVLNSNDGSTKARFHHYVKPIHHPKLTEYCSNLTGISQEVVNLGKTIGEVWDEFRDFMEFHGLTDQNTLFCTFDDWDLKTIWPNQAKLVGLQTPPYFERWVSMKVLCGNETAQLPKNIIQLLDILGLEHVGHCHSGVDDVENIRNCVKHMLWKGVVFHPTSFLGVPKGSVGGRKVHRKLPRERPKLDLYRLTLDEKDFIEEHQQAIAKKTPKAGKSQNKDDEHHQYPPLLRLEPLQKDMNNSWWATHRQKNSPLEKSRKKSLALLNKLTLENKDTICDQFTNHIAQEVKSTDEFNVVVSTIFEKSCADSKFSNLYADLCHIVQSNLSGVQPNLERETNAYTVKESEDMKGLFRRSIINLCQLNVNRRLSRDPIEGTDAEIILQLDNTKRKMMGNIKFFGDLFKHKLIHESIVHRIIAKLLTPRDKDYDSNAISRRKLDDQLEGCCLLLKTVGKQIDVPKAKEWIDQYFDYMIHYQENSQKRIHFMVLDIKELRENRWLPEKRRTPMSAKAEVFIPGLSDGPSPSTPEIDPTKFVASGSSKQQTLSEPSSSVTKVLISAKSERENDPESPNKQKEGKKFPGIPQKMLSSRDDLHPQVFRRVAKEMRTLVKEPIDGIQLSSDEETLAEINAEIKGPEGTPYEGGTFRVKLVLGSTFPQQPPKGYFLTPIFHPNVDQTKGEICVNTLTKDWSSDHKLKHVLIVIRCLLIHPNPDSALNEEAGRLLHESYKEFFSRAALYTQIHAIKKKELTVQKENLQNLSETFSINPSAKPISNQRVLRRKPGRGKGKKTRKSKKTLRRL